MMASSRRNMLWTKKNSDFEIKKPCDCGNVKLPVTWQTARNIIIKNLAIFTPTYPAWHMELTQLNWSFKTSATYWNTLTMLTSHDAPQRYFRLSIHHKGRAIAQAAGHRASHSGGPGSSPCLVKWDLWLDIVAQSQVFSEYFGFPCFIPPNSPSSQSPGAGTIG
jgi:hypothetical protein